jgi:hypothetical protein
MDRSELGIPLSHFSEDWLRCFFRETHGHGADVQRQPDFGCAGLPMKNESRAQRRMSGERKFLLHGKDADADSAILFCSGVGRQNEGGFGKIHFAGQGLHLFSAEAPAVQENRQRVSREGAVGKHVDLHHGELSRRSSHA